MKDSERWIFTRTTWTHDHCRIRGGAVRSVGPRPTNPTAFQPSTRSRVRRGQSRSTRLRARPLDRTGCARASVRSGGHEGQLPERAVTPVGHPIGRPPTADRPISRRPSDRAARARGRSHERPPYKAVRPLSLSLFFSPLQFTLEWIRSGFGWQNPSIGFSSLGEKK